VIKFRVLNYLPIRRTGSYAKKHKNAKNDAEEIRYEMSELSFISTSGMRTHFFLFFQIVIMFFSFNASRMLRELAKVFKPPGNQMKR
jgi:ssDNA-specific exonuclease RecJ